MCEMNTTAIYKCLKCGRLWEIPLIAIPNIGTKCPFCGGEGWKIGEFNPNDPNGGGKKGMRKEDIVVSLKLAKKLKEAGVNSPSLFYWRIWDDKSVDLAMGDEDDFDYSGAGRKVREKIHAYTVMELIDALPSSIKTKVEGKEYDYMLAIHKGNSNWYAVSYESGSCDDFDVLQEFASEKLANALARTLIWWRKKQARPTTYT